MVKIPVKDRFMPIISEQVRIRKLEPEQIERLQFELNFAGMTDDMARKLCRVSLCHGYDSELVGEERCARLQDFRGTAADVAKFNNLRIPGEAAEQLQGDQAAEQLEGDPVDDQAADHLEGDPVDDQVAEQLEGDTVDDQVADHLEGDTVDDQVAEQLEGDPVDDQVAEQLEGDQVDEQAER